MFLGKRLKTKLTEGWNWVPLYPFISNYVAINIEKKTDQFGPQNVRTPDNAVVSTSEAVVWRPGIDGSPEFYIIYLNSGGEEGVRKILRERIEDRVKTWGSSNQEGPATWKEALGLRDDAHAVLAEALLGQDVLGPVENPIPTGTWMRFFNIPQSAPTAYDVKNGWASMDDAGHWSWSGLQTIFSGYGSDAQAKLKSQVETRKKEVDRLRGARGDFGDKSLGITILGFTVNEIEVTGEVAKAAELEEKEKKERAADEIEIRNVSDRAADIRARHPDLSSEKAFEIVQTERKKVGKTIIAISGAQTALGSDLLGLAGVAREVVSALKDGGGQDQSAKKDSRQDKSKNGSDDRTKGGRGQPSAESYEKAAKEFFDSHGVYPTWDPLHRTPTGDGKKPGKK